MEVQLIDVPNLWVQPTGKELEEEREAFFKGLSEDHPVMGDFEDETEAPF